MNWVQIGNQMADGHSLRTYAAEIEGIGCLILVNNMHDGIVFVPGVRLEGERLVPIPPPQETFSYSIRSNRHASPTVSASPSPSPAS